MLSGGAVAVAASEQSSRPGSGQEASRSRPQTELHLFIVWMNGRDQQARILDDLRERFVVRGVYELLWDAQRFPANLARFYAKPLPAEAVSRYGNGPFLLITVSDLAPRYAWRKTRHQGQAFVNVNVFDSKERFRAWTDHTNRVHATNSEAETRRDLMLLLGQDADTYRRGNQAPWDGTIERIERDLLGAAGWASGRDMFAALNVASRYVVLRNVEGLPDQLPLGGHDAVELLTDDYAALIAITDAKPLTGHKPRWGGRFHVRVAGHDVLFAFRIVGDRYFDPKWAESMLERRVLDKRGFFRLADDDYFYSLAYQAMMQKAGLPDVCRARLLQLAQALDVPFCAASGMKEPHAIKALLDAHLVRQGYRYTEPRDPAVFCNFDLLDSRVPHLRRKVRKLRWRLDRHVEPALQATMRLARTMQRRVRQ